jgi:SagB-type dehydrogenase family enzyme
MTLRSPLCVALLLLLAQLAACGGGSGPGGSGAGTAPPSGSGGAATVDLPAPRSRGPLSLEEAIGSRRSVRAYAAEPLSLDEVGQLLWAAQGVTDPVAGSRSAPSAGALYPLEVFLVAGSVTGLGPGVYRYLPAAHALEPTLAVDPRQALYGAALSQQWVADAPAVLIIAGVFARTTGKYGERGRRYVYLEAGHAAQNVCLQATALGLGTVSVGAFQDGAVRRAVGMGVSEEPIYLMPVGRPAAR